MSDNILKALCPVNLWPSLKYYRLTVFNDCFSSECMPRSYWYHLKRIISSFFIIESIRLRLTKTVFTKTVFKTEYSSVFLKMLNVVIKKLNNLIGELNEPIKSSGCTSSAPPDEHSYCLTKYSIHKCSLFLCERIRYISYY